MSGGNDIKSYAQH